MYNTMFLFIYLFECGRLLKYLTMWPDKPLVEAKMLRSLRLPTCYLSFHACILA